MRILSAIYILTILKEKDIGCTIAALWPSIFVQVALKLLRSITKGDKFSGSEPETHSDEPSELCSIGKRTEDSEGNRELKKVWIGCSLPELDLFITTERKEQIKMARERIFEEGQEDSLTIKISRLLKRRLQRICVDEEDYVSMSEVVRGEIEDYVKENERRLRQGKQASC